MGKIKWDIEDVLSVGENIIYQCELEDEEENAVIPIYLTNFRVIWINGEFVSETEWKREFLKYPFYFVTGLLVCLLRSNGIFIFIGTAICLLLCRKQKKILL